MHPEFIRKAIHTLIGVGFAGAPFILTRDEVILAASIFTALTLVAELLSRHLPLGRELGRSGSFFFALGISITAYLFLPQLVWVYVFGVLTVALADSAAALVGTVAGRTPFIVFRTRKTAEGSLAFFAAIMALLLVMVPERDMLRLFAVAVLLTNIELFSVRGLDNLTLPVIGSFLYLVVTS
ncbi:hypothetical protein GVX82_03210 [Patescibacteria group bacterium]|jgi:dolichol kinase|nr:hypothetical protein [Patescibacteria group bacterium]